MPLLRHWRDEGYSRYRDFKAFHADLAVAFKKHLAEQHSKTTGNKLSKATLYATLAELKRFFQWLAGRPGYKSRLKYTDGEFFNLSEKETRIATARREKKFPTLEQVKHVIGAMPSRSEIEQRDRALVAFTLLMGARDSAIASMKLKDVDLAANCFYQDAREVDTKNSKTFTTYFFPVGDEIRQIVEDWMKYLCQTKLWGNDDALFPATKVAQTGEPQFRVVGLDRKHWSSATRIRKIFREAFQAAGLPYFNPHSLRNTLVQLGETVCKTPEEFKAWSQNLGHEQVLTTFYGYGQVAGARQGQIMRDVAKPRRSERTDVDEIAKAVVRVVGCAESIRDSKFQTGAIAAWGQQINCLSENLYFSIRYS